MAGRKRLSPRKSVDSLFGIELDEGTSGSIKQRKLSTGVRGAFSTGWPAWRTIRKNPQDQSQPLTFTIKMADSYQESDTVQGTKEMFAATAEMASEIRSCIASEQKDRRMTVAMERALEAKMSEAVFGSNRIENAGEGFMETISLCLKIFRGEELGPYAERPEDYQQRLEAMIRNSLSPGDKEARRIRSRREVVQHALALQHMVDIIVRKDRPFTEQLFCETHAALCEGVDSASGHSAKKYAGRYRSERAYAGTTEFKKASMVPEAMKSLVSQLNDAIAMAEQKKEMDPFMLAANFCDFFVNIHPFADGNGRMCRILLNTILLKFAGIVVVLGEQDQDKDEYLGVAYRSGQQGGWPCELGSLVLKQAKKSMRDTLAVLKGEASVCGLETSYTADAPTGEDRLKAFNACSYS